VKFLRATKGVAKHVAPDAFVPGPVSMPLLTVNGFALALEPGFQMCCTACMAEEKSRSKDIILWIITVALIALAIFWYKR
jgi:hypothetical protein